jgi:hypothetical protein
MDETKQLAVIALLEKIRQMCEPGECSSNGLPSIDRLAHAAECILCDLNVSEDETKAYDD